MKKHNFKKGRSILRSFFLCTLLVFFSSSAFGNHIFQNTRIDLKIENVTLKEALKAIEKVSDYSFYYNDKQINTERIVSINAKNKSITAVLGDILIDCSYRVENKKVILTPLQPQQPQQKSNTITGTVLDDNGEALIGASVSVVGTQNGTVTDIDGNFNLTIPDAARQLKISYLGFKEQIVSIDGKRSFDIILREDAETLEEIIVVGYGTQRKKDLTGGIVSLSAEKLEQLPTTSIAQRLQGQVSGMNISSVNAQPGEASTIRIRGEKSLSGGNEPLIVLDGIPFNGTMNEIDQNSIENISVLKDASSAAIYGARAANGVILITSKRGQVGKPTVRYNGYLGVQSTERRFNLMNGEENIALLKEFYRDRGDAEEIWKNPEAFLNTALIDNYKNGVETDWQDEIFRNAFQQEHQLSLSGATDLTNYYASISYLDQEGVVKNTQYKKYSATVNLSQKIGKWLTVGVNTQMSEQDNSGVTPQYYYAYRMSPYASVYDENGKYLRYPMWTETMYYSPFADNDGTKDNTTRSIYTGWYADIALPVKGLSYRTNFGYAFRTIDRGEYYGSTTYTGNPYSGIATIYSFNYTDWTWENIVRYNRDFGVHHIDATGLISAQKTRNKESEMTGKGFLNDNNLYHNIDMAQGEKTIKSDMEETALASYMARFNYNYDGRYLLTLTGRYDGYSAFGANNKWAFFPSIAGGWVLSEESFFKDWDPEKIDFIKLRLSYGANGNQAIKAYQTLTKLKQQDYIFGDGTTYAGGLASDFNKGNPNLKWETTYSFNMGLDFGFFHNRLTGNLDLYLAKTKDLLMNRSVAVMNGYTSIMDNVGKTQSKGFDLTVNTINLETKDFQWRTGVIFSGNWNKILALREDGKDDITNKWFIGKPIAVNYDYKVIGVWQSNEKDEAAKYGAVPGDAKLKDKNDDGKIDADDREIIGSKLPTWTAGLTNTFTYKDWSFSFFLNGVFDISKENYSLLFERMLFEKNVNFISGIDYWTPENPSTEGTRLNYKPVNSHKFYTDASYVRIQDINLSYNFPKTVTNKLGIGKLMMYANVRNLYTFSKTNKYGVNPEQSIIGGETITVDSKTGLKSGSYPIPRAFVFGLNITF